MIMQFKTNNGITMTNIILLLKISKDMKQNYWGLRSCQIPLWTGKYVLLFCHNFWHVLLNKKLCNNLFLISVQWSLGVLCAQHYNYKIIKPYNWDIFSKHVVIFGALGARHFINYVTHLGARGFAFELYQGISVRA